MPAEAPLIEAAAVSVRFGALRVLENVDLAVGDGEIVDAVGRIAKQHEAGRKALTRAREALRDIRGLAQEVQRGTDVFKQGDAHGCGANIEEAADSALAAMPAERSE